MSCAWLENRDAKDVENTVKYSQLQLELTKRYPEYKIIQYNIIMDVLGGFSRELEQTFILHYNNNININNNNNNNCKCLLVVAAKYSNDAAQQGQTKSITMAPLAAALRSVYNPGATSGISRMLVFAMCANVGKILPISQ